MHDSRPPAVVTEDDLEAKINSYEAAHAQALNKVNVVHKVIGDHDQERGAKNDAKEEYDDEKMYEEDEAAPDLDKLSKNQKDTEDFDEDENKSNHAAETNIDDKQSGTY